MTRWSLRGLRGTLLLIGIFLLVAGGPVRHGEVLAIIGELIVGGSFQDHNEGLEFWPGGRAFSG